MNGTASGVAFFTFEKGINKTEYLFSVNLLHLWIGLQHLSDHIRVAHKTLGYWVVQHLEVENRDRFFTQQAVNLTWRKVSGLLISSLCILCCISMKLALPIPSKPFLKNSRSLFGKNNLILLFFNYHLPGRCLQKEGTIL